MLLTDARESLASAPFLSYPAHCFHLLALIMQLAVCSPVLVALHMLATLLR